MKRTIVVGGGIIGYACAWQLALRKHRVILVADQHTSAAEHSAGIIFPNHLNMVDQPGKMELSKNALEAWPVWAESLGDSSFKRQGMIQAFVEGKKARTDEWASVVQNIGWEAEHLTPDQIAEHSPHLHVGQHVAGGYWLPEVCAVDPQHHLGLLEKVFQHAGGKVLRTEHVTRIVMEDDKLVGVQWPDGSQLAADHVVVATGWSDYSWLPEGSRPRLEAHMGEHMVLRVSDDWPRQPVLVFPGTTSLLRSRNRMWIGVTVRPGDNQAQLTVDGALGILENVTNLMPQLKHARILDVGAGIRPVSQDGLPWVGPTDIPGLLLAAGHGRSGILQAPIAAKSIVDCIETGSLPEWSSATDPRGRCY